jgi:hypothetical protein
MLGRKSYTREELDHAKSAIKKQLAAYKRLAEAILNQKGDAKARSALEDLEPHFFNDLTLVLDRYFVHRLRMARGKNGNPLNEVELISESLMNSGGVLRGNKVVKYVPDRSVVGLKIDDRIRLKARTSSCFAPPSSSSSRAGSWSPADDPGKWREIVSYDCPG